MEFKEIKPPRFGVAEPGNPYPNNPLDSSGNVYNPDVDHSKASGFSSGDVDNFHARCDVDSSQTASHHTLGSKRNQASPGSHVHDGTNSQLIGHGLGLTLTGSKGGNVALTNLINMLKSVIEFTDSTT